MGPGAGLDRCGKSRPPPGFEPRTFQPVASRYTDYATRPTELRYERTKYQAFCGCLRSLYFRRDDTMSTEST